jgi:hypothetical protein
LALGLVIVGLLAPVGYVELACRGTAVADTYQPLIVDPAWQRAKSRTLLTYPEWHIVHAYDDYARVISQGDPHEFGYLRAVSGFWAALCPLSRQAAEMGEITGETKATIYTIGVSFTAEMLAKAAYEETLGRVATWIRGSTRSPLDDLSARQAAEYAVFLQQTPWYKWDFASDAQALNDMPAPGFRAWERKAALGLEYRGKAVYAGVIAGAVEGVGADELRLRSVISGLDVDTLSAIEGVQVIAPVAGGILVETDRYRVFTQLADRLARAGADFVEIAGNDQILFTAISDRDTAQGAVFSFARQGYDDTRHLILVRVADLAKRLRDLDGLVLEHVHDF